MPAGGPARTSVDTRSATSGVTGSRGSTGQRTGHCTGHYTSSGGISAAPAMTDLLDHVAPNIAHVAIDQAIVLPIFQRLLPPQSNYSRVLSRLPGIALISI